jgi:parvulin-like peptidyl-prolyl isomerase
VVSRALTNRNIAIGLGAILVLVVVVVAITRGLGDEGVPSGDVAVVDADVNADAAGIEDGKISQDGFDEALTQAAKGQGMQQPPDPGSQQYTALRDQAMGDLLDIAWILGEADERGVEVTDSEIQRRFQQTKSQSFRSEADYQRFLDQAGFDQDDVDLRIELQILSDKIQEEVGAPYQPPQGDSEGGENVASDEDVEKYYEANEAQFAQPEQRDVRVIVNSDQAKVEQAKSRLEADDSPASWKQVAAEFSTDPTSRRQGGLRQSVTEGILPPPVDEAVFSAEQGALEGPINTPGGAYLFQVESVAEASTQPLDEQLRQQIRQQITGQEQQTFFQDFLADYNAKWTNLTVCAEEYLLDRCDNFTPPPQACPPAATVDQGEQAVEDYIEKSGCPPPVVARTPGPVGAFEPFATATGQLQRPHPAGEDQAQPTLPTGIPGGIPGATPGATGAPPPGG